MPPLTPRNAEIRAQNVTASEVGALLGFHPYATPEGIWDRLHGLQKPRSSESMDIGSAFEEAILRYAEQRDRFRARLNQRTFVHDAVRLCATPDAFQLSREGLFIPEHALVEIKMSGRPDQWAELPERVAWQVRAQMACTGRDTAYVYVLVGMSLRAFQLYRDLAKEAELLAAVQRFWTDHVAAGVRPEPVPMTPPIVFSFEADQHAGDAA